VHWPLALAAGALLGSASFWLMRQQLALPPGLPPAPPGAELFEPSAPADVAASALALDAAAPLPLPGAVLPSRESVPPVPDLLQVPPLDLEPLRRDDARLRALVGKRALARHPLVTQGLAEPEFVFTLVGAVLDVAEGRSPADRFPFLTPALAFAVRGDPQKPQIAPESYKRYDALVDAFAALDSVETVRLYRQLEPIFDEAMGRHGYPGSDFDETLGQALSIALDTPVVPAEQPLLPHGAKRYAFANEALQTLEPVQRQLLRMGPRNVERVLDKLADLQRVWQTQVTRE
jgi:hypothetical protein